MWAARGLALALLAGLALAAGFGIEAHAATAHSPPEPASLSQQAPFLRPVADVSRAAAALHGLGARPQLRPPVGPPGTALATAWLAQRAQARQLHRERCLARRSPPLAAAARHPLARSNCSDPDADPSDSQA